MIMPVVLLNILRVVGTASFGWVLSDLVDWFTARKESDEEFTDYFRSIPWIKLLVFIAIVVVGFFAFIKGRMKKTK